MLFSMSLPPDNHYLSPSFRIKFPRSLPSTISEERSETFVKKFASTKFYRFSFFLFLLFFFFFAHSHLREVVLMFFSFIPVLFIKGKLIDVHWNFFFLRDGKRNEGEGERGEKETVSGRSCESIRVVIILDCTYVRIAFSRQRQILLNCSFLLVYGECKASIQIDWIRNWIASRRTRVRLNLRFDR